MWLGGKGCPSDKSASFTKFWNTKICMHKTPLKVLYQIQVAIIEYLYIQTIHTAYKTSHQCVLLRFKISCRQNAKYQKYSKRRNFEKNIFNFWYKQCTVFLYLVLYKVRFICRILFRIFPANFTLFLAFLNILLQFD